MPVAQAALALRAERADGWSMSNFSWETTVRELFDRCVERYRSGDQDFAGYYSDEDLAFLGEIGYQPRELFDFVEDYCDEATPSPEAAVLIAAARRDFFHVVQNGETSEAQTLPDDLPARDSELEGFVWLPRIITKARAKLRGELHPDIMFSCGGDRNFLRTHDIHPADFLRAVWAAGDDDAKIAAYVKANSKA